METWKPDKNSIIPLYKQLADHIFGQIKFGRLATGEKLSVRKLAASYQVGANTVHEALSILKEDGIVESLPRSGTRVSPNAVGIISGENLYWYKHIKTGKQFDNSNIFYNTSYKATDDISIKLDSYGLDDSLMPHKPLMMAMKSFRKKPGLYKLLNTFNRYGLLDLRKSVSEHLKNYDIATGPENIIMFNGWMEAVNTVINAILSPGLNFYTMFSDVLVMMGNLPTIGAIPHVLAYDEDGLDVNELRLRLKHKNSNILSIYSHNHFPSGVSLSAKRREQLLKLMSEYNLPVIENDFYRDLWIDQPPPPLKASTLEKQIIYMGSFSHMVNSGLKLAWAVVPDVLVERIADVKIQFYSTNNSMLEVIAGLMLSEGYYAEYMEWLRTRLPARIQAVDALLEKYLTGIATWNSKHIVYNIWLKFRPEIDTNRLFFDCTDYYFSPSSVYTNDISHIHINALSPTFDQLESGLKAIAQLARNQMK